MENPDAVFCLLAGNLRRHLKQTGISYSGLQEIRMRIRQPLILKYREKEFFLDPAGKLVETGQDPAYLKNGKEKLWVVTQQEMDETLEYVSHYSRYAYEEEIRQGFITVPGGHRVGLCGKTVVENGMIKTIRNITFLNIRIAHEKKHCSDPLMPYLFREEEGLLNTLLISPPMGGKTTLLRDLIRNLSDGCRIGGKYLSGMSVGVVDERSEIGASYQGIPQNDLGMRTDLLDAAPKIYGIRMLLRTMSPRVIAVDEIGSRQDFEALLDGVNGGVHFLATVHGASIEELAQNPRFREMFQFSLFERFLVLKNREGKRAVEVYDQNQKRIGGCFY